MRALSWRFIHVNPVSTCGDNQSVVSPGDLITGSVQEGVCSYLAVCRSLGLTRMCPFLEVGGGCIITPGHHAVTLRAISTMWLPTKDLCSRA